MYRRPCSASARRFGGFYAAPPLHPSAVHSAHDSAMINPDRLTVKATEALNEAVDLARRSGNPLVYDLHLLMALLAQDEGIVVPILQKLAVSVAQLRETVGREMARYPKQSNAQPTLSRELNQVFDKAEADAQ